MFSIRYFAILTICFILEADAYRILGVFPLAFRSHNLFYEALMKGLAKKGHQVDVISYYELKRPPENYRTILNLANISKAKVKAQFDSIQEQIELNKDTIKRTEDLYGLDICNIMSHEKMQEVLKNPPDPAYDLVITEAGASSCYYGLGPLFNMPVICATANSELPPITEYMGNPLSSSFFPALLYGKFEIKSFWDRLQSAVKARILIYRYNYFTENQSSAMRNYFGPNIPSVREVERMVALCVVNTHYSLHGVRPTTPALIEAAGLHIEEDESNFTRELENWMEESKDGVVYISFGSTAPIETLPKETMLSMFSSFAKLAPIRVLMKTTKGYKLPPGLPNNVLTMTWIPQIPVLRHNNTRLFITHGGLHSLEEAVYFGVPIIGVPLFFDNKQNIEMIVSKRMGIQIDHEKITEKSLNEALTKILNEEGYREAAKNLSRLFRDRPMSPLKTAVFWIEYVIRNGPQSLRSPAVDMYWWQVQLLDVYGFLLSCLVLVLYVVTMIGKNVYKKFVRKNAKSGLKKD